MILKIINENNYRITVKELLEVYNSSLCDKTIEFLKQFNENTIIETSIYDLNCWCMKNIK